MTKSHLEQSLMNTSKFNLKNCVIFLACGISLGASLAITSSAVADSRWQAHSDLKKVAEQHIRTHFTDNYEIQVSFGRLDKRLRLGKCSKPLHAFTTGNRIPAGAINIGVRCDVPDWKVRIPARVRAYTKVLVAKQPIAKGSIIHAQDLRLERHDVGKYFAGVFLKQPDLLGMVAKRSIRQSTVITPRMVKPRRLVSRGEIITILAESNGLTIRTSGEALMHGQRGQIITVKNSRSGKKISGEVIARSTVRVKM